MKSILESTLNTRAILPDSLRFIRSDVPAKISEKETEWLIKNNITTVVDLRTVEERAKKPCKLETDNLFKYYSIPVTGGDIVPKSVDDVSKSYINMLDSQMYRIIDLICNAKSNVLYFCNAGKDRTGVVSAILLLKFKMDLDYIANDYMQSKSNLKEALNAYAEQYPDVDIEIITPQERYIREFIKYFLKNCPQRTVNYRICTQGQSV